MNVYDRPRLNFGVQGYYGCARITRSVEATCGPIVWVWSLKVKYGSVTIANYQISTILKEKLYTLSTDMISDHFWSIKCSVDWVSHDRCNCKYKKQYWYGDVLVSTIWMDGWVRVLRPFNSISVISRRWKSEHERLCAMKRRLRSGRIAPPAGFESATPWSEVGSVNRSATRALHQHYMVHVHTTSFQKHCICHWCLVRRNF